MHAPRADVTTQALEKLVAHLPGVVYRCRNDAAYTTQFVSDGVHALTGFAAGLFRSGQRHFGELVHEADRARVREEIQAALARGEAFEITYRIVTAAGTVRWVWEKGQGVRDARGRVTALEGFITDIDERQRAAEALRESEERLRTIIEAEPECVKVVSAEGALLEMNPAGLAMLEAGSLAEVQARPLLEFLLPEHRAAFVGLHQRVMSGESGTLEFEVQGLKGARRWLETHAAPLRDAAGAVASLLGITRDVTARKRAEQALRESEERFRSLAELSSDFYWEQDENLRFVERMGGADEKRPYPREAVIGRTRWDLPALNLAEADWAAHRAVLEARREFRNFEIQRPGPDGRARWLSTSGRPIFDAGGRFRGYRGTGRDITARKEAETRIRRLNRVHAVLSGINALIVRAAGREELYREACRIAVEEGGFPIAWIGEVDRREMRVRPVSIHGADRGLLRDVRMTLREDAPEGLGVIGEAVLRRAPVVANDAARDARIRAKGRVEGDTRALVVLPLAVGGETRGVLALHSDTVGFFDEEEMKLLVNLAGDIAFALDHLEKAERVNYLAYYDQLTGLANSTLFHERLGQQVQAARREEAKLALLLLDVERFKAINDSIGRQAGDTLLAEIALRLGRAVDRDMAARVGADHFAVALPTVKGRSQTVRAFEAIARGCFGQPFQAGGAELRLSARAGIALYPADGADAHALFANAEAALGEAQRSGERYCFHTRELTAGTGAQLALENKLRRALEKGEFVLHYQPKVQAQTCAITGLEALIRWQSPELGLVPPMEFIPLLEETGLILEVGAWALERAALDRRAWVERGLAAPRVAVNVSPIQLRQRDFVARVERGVAAGGSAAGIDLEITESLIMERVGETGEKLERLRALGIGAAIDDFGTGYSSLAYLARLPAQAVKIDRSFVVGMLAEEHTMTLVQTIIALAHSLRLTVIAEGVDSEDQARVLRLLRCDEMQGYLFGRPLPFEDTTALLGHQPRT